MLGSLRRRVSWRWAAMGKHPAAADYIQLADGSPVLQAVADWMTHGYDHMHRGRNGVDGHHSWRFWLRGAKRGSLIAGVIRDSSDRIGRPYPLLIMGEGLLKGWEQRWEWLPAALNQLWRQAEYIGAHPYDSTFALSEAVNGLNAPDAAYLAAGESPVQVDVETDKSAFSICEASLHREGRAMIPLNTSNGADSIKAGLGWHAQLKSCATDLPRAVFMGGSPKVVCLAVLAQPLGVSDFELLWSV